jgi:RsiW-degrading membrane proteinase PrsW (M82 family)
VLWTLGILSGAALILLGKFIPPLFGKDPIGHYMHMAVAMALAFPACFIYLWVPVLIDRYDPEPWWCLLIALLWGAFPADGFAFWMNTFNGQLAHEIGGKELAAFVGPVLSAPIVEEGLKGLGVFGIFLFLRRQFDGVVDGVVYATFIALGFAASENITYYTRFSESGGGAGLTRVFIIRGILSPWLHPLFTSMTGIGFGIARETSIGWLRWVAPVAGYVVAVTLHAIWNGTSWLGGVMRIETFPIVFPLWILFVLAFGVVLIVLVAREGRIIRKFLEDEVLLGNMTRDEVALVTSPFGRIKALLFGGGLRGRKFVDAASRLALSKWHATRAMKGQKMTLSADFIVPLRQELHALRAGMKR